MPTASNSNRIQTDGKFFRIGEERIWLRMVTYGPFPEDKLPENAKEFAKIKAAHFQAIRTYTFPEVELLDAAEKSGLKVFVGLDWWQYGDFTARPEIISAARIKLAGWLKENGNHPALAGVYVGNEISADLVRWMGPILVRRAIESFIDLGKEISPHLLFAYANYPSTEYLEPGNADFTAFNIYLENRENYAAYLRRVQNIAGDRPLVISEFGLDSKRSSPEIQAETLRWALEESHIEEAAGMTIYAWSDLWRNGDREILDWDFGLTDRELQPKLAYQACSDFTPPLPAGSELKYSIIICTRNGEQYIRKCLEAVRKLQDKPHETIVVSDGSTDQTERIVTSDFPEVTLLKIPPSGLSTARNTGAAHASGDILSFTDDDCEPHPEWLTRLGKAFSDTEIASAGGPNLPPPARSWVEAVIRSAPGAPSHVLLDDTTAEHLPGCNISVRKSIFEQIGGFDPDFHTAGDDVDFCWRLTDAGHKLSFVPGAFVWHWRRPSIRAFLRQQIGYGKAEKILLGKHPSRFTKNGEAQWKGFIYGGGAVRASEDSIIYHGPMGQAGYQSIVNRMLPLRPLDPEFSAPLASLTLSLVSSLQAIIRTYSRGRIPRLPISFKLPQKQNPPYEELGIYDAEGRDRNHFLDMFIQDDWQPSSATSQWDLKKSGTYILIATERFEGGAANNLIRVQGHVEPVRKTLSKIH